MDGVEGVDVLLVGGEEFLSGDASVFGNMVGGGGFVRSQARAAARHCTIRRSGVDGRDRNKALMISIVMDTSYALSCLMDSKGTSTN